MRVIAGKYRSRQLMPIDGERVRPTTDKVKESIFGSIQFDIAGSVFVDLFAGSGAMGIEALSRGADKVYFVDDARDSIDIVRGNLTKIKVDAEDNYEIINAGYDSALSRLDSMVDIIFVDPPYKDKPLDRILDLIIENNLMQSGGKVIYEHLYDDKVESVRDEFTLKKSKKYGTIAVEVIIRK